MNNEKMNKLDLIFIIGIIIIAIVSMIIDGIYWMGSEYGGFPVFSCMSIFVSYFFVGSFNIFFYKKRYKQPQIY